MDIDSEIEQDTPGGITFEVNNSFQNKDKGTDVVLKSTKLDDLISLDYSEREQIQ